MDSKYTIPDVLGIKKVLPRLKTLRCQLRGPKFRALLLLYGICLPSLLVGFLFWKFLLPLEGSAGILWVSWQVFSGIMLLLGVCLFVLTSTLRYFPDLSKEPKFLGKLLFAGFFCLLTSSLYSTFALGFAAARVVGLEFMGDLVEGMEKCRAMFMVSIIYFSAGILCIVYAQLAMALRYWRKI